MMKKMKKLAVMLVCVMMIGVLGGCGNSFDASEYTKALLDNSYKNDPSGIVKLKIGTEEEAAEIYEQGIDAEMAALGTSSDMSEEMAAEYRKVVSDILAGAKYTVGESEKQDDGSYVVTITYEQMKIFEPAMEAYTEDITALLTELTEAAMAGEEVPSDAELYEQIYASLKDCLVDALANVTYAEPATTTVRIELVNKEYRPNESDLANLENVFFDGDALTDISFE